MLKKTVRLGSRRERSRHAIPERERRQRALRVSYVKIN